MKQAVRPRPAGSVILVRPGQPRDVQRPFQVFMVRRPATSQFAPDVFVFPGGTVQSDDLAPAVQALCAPFDAEDALRCLAERSTRPPATAVEALALYLAAVRELFEEAGVLLAEPASPSGAASGSLALSELSRGRAELQAGRLTLAEFAQRQRLRLACERLIPFSHWITPRPYPRRYDTRFFLASMPAEQEALHCAKETVEGVWVSPVEALSAHRAGRFPLVFVTQRHLERLAAVPSIEALEAFARAKPIVCVDPEIGGQDGGPMLPSELEGRW